MDLAKHELINNVKAVDLGVFKELVESNAEVRKIVFNKVLGKQNYCRLGVKGLGCQKRCQRDGDQDANYPRTLGGKCEEEMSMSFARALY